MILILAILDVLTTLHDYLTDLEIDTHFVLIENNKIKNKWQEIYRFTNK